MAILDPTDLLQLRTETAMDPDFYFLHRDELDADCYYSLILSPCHLIVFHDRPRLLTLQLQSLGLQRPQCNRLNP